MRKTNVKNEQSKKVLLFNENGITLIALIVTIIILLILVGVVINLAFGNSGIIDSATEATFKSKFREVEEKVALYQTNIKIQAMAQGNVLSTKDTLPLSNSITSTDIDNFKPTLKQEIKELSHTENITKLNLYNIDMGKINATGNYIINIDTLQIYDVDGSEYYGKVHHTLSEPETIKEKDIVVDEGAITIEGDIGWYSPNMQGFDKKHTYLEYYNINNSSEIKEIPVTEYIQNGKQNSIEIEGKTYYLDNYKEKFWANCKTTGTELEAWWVWIPRYAYCVSEDKKIEEIIFVDLQNKPIGSKFDTLPDGYIVHPAFTPSGDDGSKNLQGIWMSKYNPSNQDMASRTEDTDLCYAPDMTGFDVNCTYIELYNSSTNTYDEEILLKEADLNSVNNNKKWYSYSNRIWANIKTTGTELEAWWVWIPRYAYYMNPASKETEIIFIDTDNKPFEKELYGDTLPDWFIVHPAFTPSGDDGSKNLKGIWMSKYNPSNKDMASRTEDTDLCYAPDMTGFDREYTYIELYNSSTNTYDEEVLLKEADLNNINNNKKWYSYSNRIWANIKTTANGLEAWWVWIPRYAYYMNPASKETEIIFIDTDNKPFERELYGDTLPDWFIVHPAFTPSGDDGSKNLKGIWMSKYNPSNVADVIQGTAPIGSENLPKADDTAGNTHEHVANGAGTKLRHVTSSTKWCNAYDGTPCSNDGYYIYCSECGVRLRHYWCANHYNPSTKVIINDENVD